MLSAVSYVEENNGVVGGGGGGRVIVDVAPRTILLHENRIFLRVPSHGHFDKKNSTLHVDSYLFELPNH